MWNNSELKANAKAVLKRFGYWTPFIVTLISGFFVSGLGSSGSSAFTSAFPSSGTESSSGSLAEMFEDPTALMIFTVVMIIMMILVFAFAFAFAIFLSCPVLVGQNRFFMEHRAFGSKFERLFWGFSGGRYMPIVKTMIHYEIRIFLWSLLFVIPGIIKTYEYFMVPYILSENPTISPDRAFEISSRTTKGDKANIFFLELSFFGWILLGILTCGIGLYFLEPYYKATFAELYQVFREKAFAFGYATEEDLPGYC